MAPKTGLCARGLRGGDALSRDTCKVEREEKLGKEELTYSVVATEASAIPRKALDTGWPFSAVPNGGRRARVSPACARPPWVGEGGRNLGGNSSPTSGNSQ